MIRELKYCSDFGDINRELREIYDRFPQLSTDANNNPVLVGADGLPVSFLDTSIEPAYKLPPTLVQITASQAVVSKHSFLSSIKCIVGTAITLTIYDNQTLATGTVLFSQTMSAGDEVVFPTPIQSINGLFASFTGTATFSLGVSDAI